MSRLPKAKGFTLIELLIVIALIGILAAAVLIAINPTKRIKQARDAIRKSHINTIANALIAYYTLSGGFYPSEYICDTSTGFDGGWCVSDIFVFMISGTSWEKSGAHIFHPNDIYQSLVVKQGLLKDLPIDPINSIDPPYFFYSYEPSYDAAIPSTIGCGGGGASTTPCNYYWIGALLEAPQNPQKPVFRCSDHPALVDGPGCKEVSLPDIGPWYYYVQY